MGAPQQSFSEVAAGVRKTVDRLGRLRSSAEQVSVTETSADGAVTVTVNSGGVVTDLRITDQVSGQPGAQIATQVLATMRQAQARIAGRMDEVMRTTVGDDPELRERVLAVYHDRFPEPEPDPTEHASDTEIRIDPPDDDGWADSVLRSN